MIEIRTVNQISIFVEHLSEIVIFGKWTKLGETRSQKWLLRIVRQGTLAHALLGEFSEMERPHSRLKADKPKLRYRAVQSTMGRGVAAGGGST